jgi:phosphatidylglycerophosphate synthase
MGLYGMRPGKDSILFRIAFAVHRLGFTADAMTAIGLAFGVASGVMFALHAAPFGFTFGLISVFCDILDGTLARKFQQESKFGLLFDSAADRVAEFAVVMGAIAAGIIQPLGALSIVGSASLLTLRYASYRQGKNTDYVLFGRFERLIFILAGLLVPVVWLSTACFMVAGGFGLVSAFQIAESLGRKRK